MVQNSLTFRQDVLIVGGGPAGLATALMLAKRGWKNITVLEKRPTADYYEPDKSFNYAIDGRGQKFTDFLGITNKLSEIGVPSTEFYLTVIKADGSRKTSKLPTVDSNRKTAYWLPRKDFILLLYQEIEANWHDSIKVLFNIKNLEIKKVHVSTEQEKLEISVYKKDDSIIQFEPCLLVGCDGINSFVRNTLKEWDESVLNQSMPTKYQLQYYPSPSSVLKYKVLNLPANFPLDVNGEEKSVCDMSYAIRGSFPERKRKISLGLLPLKNPDAPRTANIITYPDHEIWNLKTGDDIYKFLEQAFPQLPIHQIISSEEAETFAKSQGGQFPIPQYCSGLYYLLNKEKSNIGIVLLGDAIHCFPPDIGQGVNSALEDVCVLNEALSQSNDNISQALPVYESLRLKDIKPLIRLAQTAFPWQYNQAPLSKLLWSINFFLRLLLNRVLPFIFSPPAFFLIQNYQLSYQEIWDKAQRTTQILYVLSLILGCSFLAWQLF
jgi:kynurenine 3-monooxygenase